MKWSKALFAMILVVSLSVIPASHIFVDQQTGTSFSSANVSEPSEG